MPPMRRSSMCLPPCRRSSRPPILSNVPSRLRGGRAPASGGPSWLEVWPHRFSWSLTAGAAAYGVFGIAGGWLVTTAAAIATNVAVSIIAAVRMAVEWWLATARAGSAVAGIMATPQSAVALFAIEFVGIAALYMLHRLLRAEVDFRGPGALCF